KITVGSLELSFPVFSSPPPETFTTFVTLGGALLETFTVSVMTGQVAPAPSASLRVHVRVPRVHVHPVPLIAVAVRPAGRVSVIVTIPVDGAPEMLWTAIE